MYEVILGNCRKKGLDFLKVLKENFRDIYLAKVLDFSAKKDMSMGELKALLFEIIDGDQRDPEVIYREKHIGEKAISLEQLVAEVLQANESKADEYKASTQKAGLVKYFSGQLQRQLKGRESDEKVAAEVQKALEQWKVA